MFAAPSLAFVERLLSSAVVSARTTVASLRARKFCDACSQIFSFWSNAKESGFDFIDLVQRQVAVATPKLLATMKAGHTHAKDASGLQRISTQST